MSLQDMVNMTALTEAVKIGPNNSNFPIHVWFERDRNTSHHNRIKIQNKVGHTNSDEFIPINPRDFSIYNNKRSNIKVNIPSKLYNNMIDFLRDNSDLIDRYYGINRDTGRDDGDMMLEDEFTKLIIDRASKYF